MWKHEVHGDFFMMMGGRLSVMLLHQIISELIKNGMKMSTTQSVAMADVDRLHVYAMY